MIPHKDEYLFKGGVFCPWCKSSEIQGGFIEIDAGEATQAVSCLECNKNWIDVYTLVEVRKDL